MRDSVLSHSDDELADAIRHAYAAYAAPASSPLSRGRLLRLHPIAVAPLAIGVVVAAVLVAGTVFAPPSAFGTWTATPSSPNPALVASVRDGCLPPPGPDWTTEDRANAADMTRLPLVIVDQRGRGAVALFAERRPDGQASMMCLSAADEDGQVMAGGGGTSTGARETPATGPLRLFTAHRNRSEWGTYTAYAGSVEPGVTQVTVERNSGSGVIASVANGYFLAWWPGDAYATSIIAYGAGGAVLAEIGNNGWDFLDDDPDPSPGVITPGPSVPSGE
jgi:hypothetical protein